MLKKIRIDKWLWTVRIFKSRTMATAACKSGKIKIKEVSVKPSYLVTRGETIEVRKEGFNLTFKVIDLLKSRVSFALAQPCYENLTSADELNKYKDWYIGKGGAERREKGVGRPTKRERRDIDTFKGDDLNEMDFDFDI